MGTINDKPSLEKTVERMLSSEFVGKIWGGDESRGDSLSIEPWPLIIPGQKKYFPLVSNQGCFAQRRFVVGDPTGISIHGRI